jgi:hypothetical protein
VAFLALLLANACKKEEKPYVPVVRCENFTRNVDSINLYIQGNWNWVEEYRVSRTGEEYIRPNTSGYYPIKLSISGDTASFYVNHIPDSVYQFKIKKLSEFTNYSEDTVPVLVYYSFFTGIRKTHVPILICRNQILMQHQYVSSFVGERLWLRE